MENLSINKRSSSIELLRIISMLFVVSSHYFVHGQLDRSIMDMGINRIIFDLSDIGNLGVDIFILISGYFMINKGYNLNKFFKLISHVAFYSISVYIILLLINEQQFNLKSFLFVCFPTIFVQYWFFTAYIVLYLLHPFINKLLNSLDTRSYCIYLILMMIIWSIIPTFMLRNLYGSEIPQFILLYSLGAFIRLNPINKELQKKYSLILISSITFILITSIIVLNIISNRINSLSNYIASFYQRNSIFIIMLAIGLFTFFKNLNIKHNNFINNSAKCIFGVYLIHDNKFIRPLLWEKLLPNGAYENSPYLIVHMIASVLIVYVVCTIIEYLRIHLIEAPLFKILDKPIEKFNKLIRETFNHLYNKFDNIFYKSQN